MIALRWKLGIFDWNGTLIDDLRLAYQSTREIFEAHGVPPPSLGAFRDEIESDFKKFYIQHGITHFDLDLNHAIRTRVFDEHWDETKLHDHEMAKMLLMRFKELGFKLAIVSAEVPEVLLRRIEQFKLQEVFDHIRAGAWPKGSALRETVEHFGVKPEETFYVDDTHEGIGLGKELGVHTFGFTRGYNTKRRIKGAKPTYVVDSLSEVLSIAQGWRERS